MADPVRWLVNCPRKHCKATLMVELDKNVLGAPDLVCPKCGVRYVLEIRGTDGARFAFTYEASAKPKGSA